VDEKGGGKLSCKTPGRMMHQNSSQGGKGKRGKVSASCPQEAVFYYQKGVRSERGNPILTKKGHVRIEVE